MKKLLTICFSGHRPNNLPWKENEKCLSFLLFRFKLKKIIINKINQGYTHFISGMARGIDLICAELIINLKEKYNIFLECAIPCLNQTEKWDDKEKLRYGEILSHADKITTISNRDYYTGCMKKRNLYMVENSNILIAIFNGNKKSGTYQTINFAKKANIEIIVLKP